jgi:hypothetical protein
MQGKDRSMKKALLTTSALVLGIALATSATAIAAGKKGAPPGLEKHGITLEQTINSDAGIGNGGERKVKGEWVPTINGEDGGQDVDPGNSGGNNNACPTPDGQVPADTAC